jgi:Stress responsive A/B Barrel Domain
VEAAAANRADRIDPMLAHIVLFKPRADLSDTDRRALEAALVSALSGIALIRGFHLGRRVRHGAGYEAAMREDLEFAAIVEFDDLDSLKAYLEHPAHKELGTRFTSAVAASFIYDYEMEDGAGPATFPEAFRVKPAGTGTGA